MDRRAAGMGPDVPGMTWSLSASGHANNKEDEAKVIDAAREAIKTDGIRATSARMFTQHHGQVDLMADDGPKPALL